MDARLGAPIRRSYAEQVRDAIRAGIADGRWTHELPSERQLSRELLVSRPTLRLALHALGREGVLQIRRGRPGRVTGTSARRVDDRARMVMILYHAQIQGDGSGLTAISMSLQQELHRLGFDLRSIDPAPPGTASIDASLERIDARFLPSYYLLCTVPTAVQRWAARARVPSLVIGLRDSGINLPSLDVDQAATLRHAVGHLVRNNHRRIGLLSLPPFSPGGLAANEMFLAACRSHAARCVTGVVQACPARPAAVEAAVRRFFAGDGAPTAIIVTDLVLAIGLYSTLAMMGLSIPRQVSVISTGHWSVLDFLRPAPTCYEYSWDKLTRRVLRIIDDHLRFGRWPDSAWKLLPSLRRGGSVRGG